MNGKVKQNQKHEQKTFKKIKNRRIQAALLHVREAAVAQAHLGAALLLSPAGPASRPEHCVAQSTASHALPVWPAIGQLALDNWGVLLSQSPNPTKSIKSQQNPNMINFAILMKIDKNWALVSEPGFSNFQISIFRDFSFSK